MFIRLSKTEEQKIDVSLGWVGAIIILVAYFLLSFSIIPAHSFWYQGLNAIGSLGLTIEAFSKKDQPLTWLNGVWVLIAVIAILQIIFIR